MILTDRESVAANTTVPNVLVGKLNEFLNENSVVSLYMTAEATGVNATLIIGNEIVVDDQEITARGVGVSIVVPDDFFAQGGGFAGDRLIVRVRNTGAAAVVVRTRIETNPA